MEKQDSREKRRERVEEDEKCENKGATWIQKKKNANMRKVRG